MLLLEVSRRGHYAYSLSSESSKQNCYYMREDKTAKYYYLGNLSEEYMGILCGTLRTFL